MIDREKLCKLMRMTESENDGEALNALRAANRMLLAEQINWFEVLGMPRGKRQAPYDPTRKTPEQANEGRRKAAEWARAEDRKAREAQMEKVYDPNIGTMFAEVKVRLQSLAKSEPSLATLLHAMQESYLQEGYLTKQQYDALKRTYRIVKEPK
jgi:hypothetical protein